MFGYSSSDRLSCEQGERCPEGRGAALESLLVTMFVIGGAVFPAAIQNTDPFKGQGAEGAVVRGSS